VEVSPDTDPDRCPEVCSPPGSESLPSVKDILTALWRTPDDPSTTLDTAVTATSTTTGRPGVKFALVWLGVRKSSGKVAGHQTRQMPWSLLAPTARVTSVPKDI
jgi:hypothetical protein